MTDLARLLLVIALALGVIAASVFGAGDSRILTPPPENAAETFFDLFAVRRHQQALGHVDATYGGAVSADSLAVFHGRIAERIGGFKVSASNRLWMSEDRASASVTLQGDAGGTETIAVPLVRTNGEWRVNDLRPLIDAAQ